jgi:DNA-binding SARP family transcriptional activator
MLKAQLFGTGQAVFRDQPLVGFPNQQCYRLLCYLLLNRHRPHDRERLAAVFWAEYPTASSRSYLRNALWRLRHALQSAGVPVDDYLMVSEDSVCFLSSDHYWLDVEAFDTAIASCEDRAGHELSPAQVACLESAVDLYVGDLLEGVYEDWCLYERERLRLLHLNTLGKLLTHHEHNGTYERGLVYGMRTLARDPTRERAHRQVMRLYWLSGDRSQALEQYRLCVQVLREELGTAPTGRTTLLYRQMLSNQFNPDAWRVRHGEISPDQPQREGALQAIVLDALQKLRRLQTMTEQTAAELYEIEHLISKAVRDSPEP